MLPGFTQARILNFRVRVLASGITFAYTFPATLIVLQTQVLSPSRAASSAFPATTEGSLVHFHLVAEQVPDIRDHFQFHDLHERRKK